MFEDKEMLEAINACLAEKGSRKFTQSVELIINFRGVDFNKAENRLNMDVLLPKGRGKQVKIAAFADGNVASDAKNAGADMIIGSLDISKQDKSEIKRMTKDWEFVVQPQIMMAFGKNFGQILGGRGKTPRPLIGNPSSMFTNLRNSIKLRIRGKMLPTVHTIIGSEAMAPEDLVENAQTIISTLKGKFGDYSIKSIFVKLSMGKPRKIGKAIESVEQPKAE